MAIRRNLSQADATRRALEVVRAMEIREDILDAEHSLKSFLMLAWPTIRPGTEFQDNWHIGCVCEHLEALVNRQIRKLIINMAPRGLKSTVCSVAFPAWAWLNRPQEKFLAASYGRALAMRDSRYTRSLIKSKWYQLRWGSKFSITLDQDEKGRFDNDKGGFRMIASVEGGVLGEGGSIRIIDDPNDLERMNKEPDTYPQSVRDWYSGTMSSRAIDPKTDVMLCIQQRASYGGDLTEHLLEIGGWDHLVIPNEWRGKTTIGPLAYPDPRSHHGELFFPARLGPEETATLKMEQRAHYPGQFNQEPSIAGKSGLKKEWFRFYNPPGTSRVDAEGKPLPVRVSLPDGSFVERKPVELPEAFEQVLQSWDMAFAGTETSDNVAGQAWGRVGANTFLLARDSEQRNFPDTLRAVRAMSDNFPCPEKLVERKANGQAVIDSLMNEIPGLIPVDSGLNKWARVAAISGYVEAGNVYLPNPDLFPWVWDLLGEFAAGQSAKHDDDTDSMSQALKRLYDASARAGVPEFRVAPRLGEPTTAQHIMKTGEPIPPGARRLVAAVPGRAAVWLAELPSGSLRVTGELDLSHLDAREVGREIARRELRNLLQRVVPIGHKPGLEILLPKLAFVPVEPIGSWAEMVEQAILTFEPEDGGYDERREAPALLRAARIRTDMVETDDAALDRLRELLAFAPPDFREVSYDRRQALALAEVDLGEYDRYLGMVEGRVVGEWPKLKISPQCPALIAELGAFRKDLDPTPFVEALLIGVCAPRTTLAGRGEIREIPASAFGQRSVGNTGRRRRGRWN